MRAATARKVVLVTGASGGIGKACAEYLALRRFRVYGTSRSSIVDSALSGIITMLQMDVTDSASVERGIGRIMRLESRIDAVVNNAGIDIVGPIEDIPIAACQRSVETNYLGSLRVCKAVLGRMREQGGGHIINISSLGGVIGLPYQGIYSASKFALEGMTEALRLEVRHFGVKVALIEPGDIRTQACRSVTISTEAYRPWFDRALARYEADERTGYPPERIGPLVERIIESPNPRLRYTFGRPYQSLVPALKRLLPQRLEQWVFSKIYGC